MKYFVDSNVFLRTLIIEDKKSFLECKEFFKYVLQHKIEAVSSSLVLAEVAWVLSSFYKVGKSEVIKSLRAILSFKEIMWVDDYDAFLALDFYEKSSVKFIDSMIASLKNIQKKEWIVISYDKDFDKLEVLRKEPREATTE